MMFTIGKNTSPIVSQSVSQTKKCKNQVTDSNIKLQKSIKRLKMESFGCIFLIDYRQFVFFNFGNYYYVSFK